MNKPVSFELAKLLKEKEFDELTTAWHQRGEGVVGCIEGKRDYYNRKGEVYTSAPIITDVVMWLYEKHGLWIKVDCASIYFWHPSIINIEDGSFKVHPYYIFFEQNNQNKMFESPNEAYEAAIKYSLNKLI